MQGEREKVATMTFEQIKQELMKRGANDEPWTDWDTALTDRANELRPGFITNSRRLQRKARS